MTLDSLRSHRMIGVIQPKNNNNELFMVGCIGKITSYIETPDYRIVLNLEGVSRFILNNRNLTTKGYYQGNVSYNDFVDDLNFLEPNIDRSELIQKYTNYFKMKNLEIDKDVLFETSNLQLLSTLAMLAPLIRLTNKQFWKPQI